MFQFIGKYIHPTRYRQMIENESVHKLDLARVHNQKLQFRDVALKGQTCMEKLRGDKGKAMDMCVQKLREPNSDPMEIQNTDNTETKAMTTPRQHSTQTTETAMATKGALLDFCNRRTNT